MPITNEHSTRTTYTTFGIGRRDPSCSGTTDLTSHIASHPELCVEGEARLIRTNFSDELGGVCTKRSLCGSRCARSVALVDPGGCAHRVRMARSDMKPF